MAARVDIPGLGVRYFDDKLSDEEINRQARALMAKAPKGEARLGDDFEIDPNDLPLSYVAKQGAKRMGAELFSDIGDVLPEMVARGIGAKDYAAKQRKEREESLQEIEENYPTYYKGLDSVHDLRSALGFGAETLGEQAGMLPLTLGTGIVGRAGAAALGARAAGKSIAESAAKRGLVGEAAEDLAQGAAAERLKSMAASRAGNIGTTAGAMTGEAAANIPEAYEAIHKETGEFHPGLATVFGGISSALGGLFDARLLNQLSPGGRQLLASKMAEHSDLVPTTWKKEFAKEAAKNFAIEGGTEGTQEFINSLAAQAAGSKEALFSKDHINSWIEAAVKGGIGGASIGAPGAALEAARTKGAVQDELDRRAAKEEPGKPEGQQKQQEVAGLLPHAPFDTMQVAPDGSTFRTPQELEDFMFQQRMSGGATGEAPAAPAPAPLGLPAPPNFVGGEAGVAKTPQELEAFARKQEEQAFKDQYDPRVAFAEKNRLEAIRKGKGTQEDMFAAEKQAAGFNNQMLEHPYQQEVAGEQVPYSKFGGVRPSPIDTGPAQPAPTITPVIDANKLATAGIDKKKNQWLYSQLVGKDLSVGADRKAVLETVDKTRNNRRASDSTKSGLEELLRGLMPIANQQRLKIEGARAGTPEFVESNQGVTPAPRNPDQPLGAGAELPSGPGPAVPSEGAEVSSGRGVEGNQLPPAGPTGGATAQPSPLKQKGKPQKREAPDESSPFTTYLHHDALNHLEENNLEKALLSHATNSTGASSKIASKLASVVKGTNVKMVDNLTNDRGKRKRGFYDPATNTIHLDRDAGSNQHVLLHEATHAALSHALDDPHNPLTRQLTQLFDKVKDSLSTAYGAKDVHEFASEAWSNPKFAQQLHGIHPNGQPHSAWDRFVRAVSNFFRRAVGLPPKPLTSAYDEVDRLISDLASPAPKAREAAALFAPKAGEHAFRGMDKIINDAPFFDDDQKAALSGAMKVGGRMVRDGIKALLPMHALSDMAEPYFPGLASKLNRLIDERGGYENKLTQGIDAVVHLAKAAIKKSPRFQEAFDKVVYTSTLNEVDPTNRESYYKNADKREKWKKVHAEYEKLPQEWKDLYVTMRNGYKGMYNEIQKAIHSRIEDTDMADDSKKTLANDIMAKLAQSGIIEPYFALGREGNHWLMATVKDEDGFPTPTVEAFKNEYQRQLRMQDLEKKGATDIKPFENVADIDYRRAPSGSFVNEALKMMEKNKVPQEAIDQMMQMFIATLPETAFAKSFQKRKGREGFNKDSIGTFERKMRGTAHQVANMVYNPKLSNTLDAMRQHTRMASDEGKGNAEQAEYLREFEKHISYVLNPKKSDIGGILSSLAFSGTLGFNLSSALVNFANVPMVVAPYLNGKYGGGAKKALEDAAKVFLGSGRKAGVEAIGSDGQKVMMDVMPSIANYDPNSRIGKKYATAVRIWGERGQLNRSQLYEMINGDTRTGPIAKVNALSGWAFHHGERMNREVTLMAAYDLEMKKLARDIKGGRISQEEAEVQAADNAVYLAEMTNGGIAAASAPRITHSALGKLGFMFKRYGVSMNYMMFKTAKEALKGETPAIRKAAMNQLKGIVGMSWLLAGTQGLPMFGAASLLYSMFADDDEDDLATATRKYMGEFVYKGPLEWMTNISVGGRIGLSDLIIHEANSGQSANTFTEQLGQLVGGPALSLAERAKRGIDKINSGHIERGVEDLLPVSITNILKAYRYATEGTNTLRGDPITGDVSAWNIAAQALGFAPADYTRQLEMNSRLKEIDRSTNEKATQLKRRYFLASRLGDFDGAYEARDKLLELGQKHPGLGINGATVDDVIERSMKAQNRTTDRIRHGVSYSKNMLDEIMREEEEWNN